MPTISPPTTDPVRPTQTATADLGAIRDALRVRVLRTILTAQAGHLGACCSSLELLTALYFGGFLRYDQADPRHPERDLVLIRGHLGPLRYNIFQLLGWLDESELDHYRQYGSRLAGHEDMFLTPGVDISPSGSLGMLLSYSVGARLAYQNQDQPNRVFCFLGDGEEQEGNVSEAARHASHLKLTNLICIIDKNGKQLSASTKQTDSVSQLETIWQGYGWTTLVIEDGHDLDQIAAVYNEAIRLSEDSLVCVIAHTKKGNGVPGAEEHYTGYHVFHGRDSGDVHSRIDLEQTILELEATLPTASPIPVASLGPATAPAINRATISIEPDPLDGEASSYDFLEEYLRKLASNEQPGRLYVMSADFPPRNFVYSAGRFSLENVRYYNFGLREQHLLATVHGLHQADPLARVVLLCGDAFLYRFADQLNALAQGQTPVVIISVEAGICGAKNGPTHQSSGQPCMAATVPEVVCFEPSTKQDFFYVMNRAVNESHRPVYVRTHKNLVGERYGTRVGPWFVARETDRANLTIVTAGMMLREAYEAAELMAIQGLNARVVSVVAPNECDGIESVIEPEVPVVVCYNGNPRYLAGQVASRLVGTEHTYGPLILRGFDYGITGSIKDVMNHLRLSAAALAEDLPALIVSPSPQPNS